MKLIAPIFFLSFLSCTLFAQDTSAVAEPNYIPILTYWNLNDTFGYTVTKERRDFDDDGVTKDSTSRTYNMKLVVAESTDSTYVIQIIRDTDWGEVSDAVSQFNLKNDDLIKIAKALDGATLEYVIDQDGTFLETRNLDKFSNALKIVFDRFVETKFESEKEQKSMKAVMSKFSSTEYLRTKLLEEIMVMHKFYGLQYAQDSTWVFEQEAPMPFTKDGVLIYKNTLLTTIPEDWGGLVRLQNNVTVDGAGLEKMVEGVFAETEEASEIGKVLENADLSIKIYISYAIYPDTGQVESMYFEKSVFTGEQLKRTDSIYVGPLKE